MLSTPLLLQRLRRRRLTLAGYEVLLAGYEVLSTPL